MLYLPAFDIIRSWMHRCMSEWSLDSHVSSKFTVAVESLLSLIDMLNYSPGREYHALFAEYQCTTNMVCIISWHYIIISKCGLIAYSPWLLRCLCDAFYSKRE